jgi:ubiquinone/menaquinone biosynthesis C-methylase UbiE
MKKNTLKYYNDLKKLTDLAMSYRSAKPLLVALHYDLFTAIEQGINSPIEISTRLSLNVNALERVLDSLVALKWLTKKDNSYANTPSGRRLLVAGHKDYVGNNLKYQEYTWDAWSDLREVLRTGKPRLGLKDWIKKDFFTEDYLRAMGDITRYPARELAQKINWSGVSRTLDVGSGAGNFSAAFVEKKPSLVATLLDLPEALKYTRKILRPHRHFSKFSFKAANYHTDEFGENEFDLVLISNVTRVEDERINAMLIKKAWNALRPGGQMIIHDYVINSSRTEPPFAALLNLHLLVFTGKGSVYTQQQYGSWLRSAGFRAINSITIAKQSPFPSRAIIGEK